MSVSSCPRCAQQVTLPVGVSNSARVRCPLCHAHYALADALVNMPPLLEVLDNGQADSGLDWLEEPAENDSIATPAASSATNEPALNLDEALDLGGEPELASAAELPEELRFDAVEMEDEDESDAQDYDTEVEELPFATSEALVRQAPVDDEPLEVSAADDADFLDFGAEVAKNEPSAEDVSELGSLDEEVAFDFEEESPTVTSVEEQISFDFEEEAGASPSQPAVDELGLPVRAVVDDEEPIELDFGETQPDPAATIDFSEEPETKGKKKKAPKVKKPARVKAPKEPGERSVVGRLISVVLAGLIAIPLALYGALWISSDYDFIGMRKWLPSVMLPAAKPTRSLAQAPPTPPPATPVDTSSVVPGEPAAEEPAATAQAPTEEAAAAPQQPTQPEPATETPPANEPTTQAPTEPEPASPAPAEEMPAETPSEKPAEPSNDPLTDPADTAAVSTAEPKEEMPAEIDPAAPAADNPADPFGEVAPPETTPADATPAPPAEPEEPLGPRNAKKFSPEDVLKAAQDFGAADQRMVAALASKDKNELKKARAGFFLSLYHFADVLATMNHDPFENQPADFQQGMRQLARDTDRLKELRGYAAKWLGFGKRTTPGIVLAGTVESAEQVGKLHHMTVKLTDDAPSVEIVSQNDPRAAAGDEVIVMGTIVQQPDEQLAGYEGTAPVVVWSGVTFNTQAAEQ